MSNCLRLAVNLALGLDSASAEQVEEYMAHHTQAEFTHSICPDGARGLYQEISDKALKRLGPKPSA